MNLFSPPGGKIPRGTSLLSLSLAFFASVVSDSATPSTVAHQAPLSMGFSRQYWSGLPFPSPRDLAGPGHYSQILYHLSHQGSDRINKRFYIARNFRHRFSFLLLQPSGHGDTWPGAGTEHKVCLGLQENEALIRERRDNPSKPSVILATERADEKKLEV